MGIIKMPSNVKVPKSKTSVVDIDPPISRSVSPAPSSIVSQGSCLALLPVTSIAKDEGKARKKKATPQSQAAKTRKQRIKNTLWSVLFGVLFAATLIVVAALARSLTQSIRSGAITLPCTFGRRRLTQPLPQLNSKSISDIVDEKENVCVHRRTYWEPNGQNMEIIHDFSSKFSAIIEHNSERCLIFDMHKNEQKSCPPNYPWNMDPKLGIPVCRGSLSMIAPVRRVMRQISNQQEKNITYTGSHINALCYVYPSFKVEKVLVEYFDIHNKRVAKRDVASALEDLMEEEAKAAANERNDSDEHTVDPTMMSTDLVPDENGIGTFIRSVIKSLAFWRPSGNGWNGNQMTFSDGDQPDRWEILLSTVNRDGKVIDAVKYTTTHLTETDENEDERLPAGARGRGRRLPAKAKAKRKMILKISEKMAENN